MKSTVAVLGTIRELHKEAIEYDLRRLADLIAEKEPDLLCVEMGQREWEAHDLKDVSIEYREALLPLAEQSDIVVVPIDDVGEVALAAPESAPLQAIRNLLIAWLHGLLTRLQRWAGGPRAINSHLFGAVCMALCGLAVFLAGREVRRAWRDKNRRLVENVLACIRRDPGGALFLPAPIGKALIARLSEGASGSPRLESSPYAELTQREREILGLLTDGLSNKDIAQRLYISVRTVEMHLSNIYGKLGCSSRLEAATYVARGRRP